MVLKSRFCNLISETQSIALSFSPKKKKKKGVEGFPWPLLLQRLTVKGQARSPESLDFVSRFVHLKLDPKIQSLIFKNVFTCSNIQSLNKILIQIDGDFKRKNQGPTVFCSPGKLPMGYHQTQVGNFWQSVNTFISRNSCSSITCLLILGRSPKHVVNPETSLLNLCLPWGQVHEHTCATSYELSFFL